MKFKVGDKVKAVDNLGLFPNGALGIVGRVDPSETRQGYFVHFDDGQELWCWTDKTEAAPVASPKIVITADGKTTLARLYDGDKVVKSKEATCNPSDAFSFQTGAELAFKRLFEKPVTEKPEPPKVEKPKFSWEAFKSGKIAVHCDTEEKAKEFCAAARERFPDKFRTWESGETSWKTYGAETRYGISDTFKYGTWGFDGYTIIDYPFTVPEPKTEPVKLYCVESFEPGEWLTKGKIYESTPDFRVTYDGGFIPFSGYPSIAAFKDANRRTGGPLYPLVKRPAKVGEWVYCTENCGGFTKAGTIYSVVSVTSGGTVSFHDPSGYYPCTNGLPLHLYLTLDGYQPKEKKPEYYNGKVVCVGGRSCVFTVGKMYEYKNGIITNNDGDAYNKNDPAKTVNEALNRDLVRFIEYKGEA